MERSFIDTFKNGMPTYATFQNGWFCITCDNVTEHHKGMFRKQICDVCKSPTNLRTIKEIGYLPDPSPWRIQKIIGIDYLECFGRDQDGEIIYHKNTYRRLPSSMRKPEQCGIWIDGKQVQDFYGMQKLGFAIQKRTNFPFTVTSKEN